MFSFDKININELDMNKLLIIVITILIFRVISIDAKKDEKNNDSITRLTSVLTEYMVKMSVVHDSIIAINNRMTEISLDMAKLEERKCKVEVDK